jgi:hypothetical protein
MFSIGVSLLAASLVLLIGRICFGVLLVLLGFRSGIVELGWL